MKKILATGFAMVVAASGAQAAELIGANMGLSYGKMTEAPFNNQEKTTLDGSAELAFAPSLSVQGDLAFTAFNGQERDADSYGLHAIYNTNNDLALGAFVAYDDASAKDITTYGIEAAGRLSGIDFEAYAGLTDDDTKMGDIFGLTAQIDIINDAQVGLRYDNATLSDLRVERLSLIGSIPATQDVTLTAELGKMRVNNSNGEAFFTIGAKFNFGGMAAPTFKQRNLLSIVPGL